MKRGRVAAAALAGVAAVGVAYLTIASWIVVRIGVSIDAGEDTAPLDGWGLLVAGLLVSGGLCWLCMRLWRSAKPA